MGNKSLAAGASLLIGAAYVGVGIIGFFITGFGNFLADTDDTLLFGFASINPLHNLVHIVVGAFLIAMTRFSTPTTEGALMGVGLFYIVAFVIGVVAPDNLTIISMNGAGDGENFVHIFTGVTALTAGLISVAQSEAAAKKSGIRS
ncbi:MAG: DUF4383 domain-containing protein [Solirubrobacteraceae bacterium]|nr:DUF4383 domain-containing protein [Solirubrobacteraceae bacterium]